MNIPCLNNASENSDANVKNMITQCVDTLREALAEDLDGIDKIDIMAEPKTFYRITFSVYPKSK